MTPITDAHCAKCECAQTPCECAAKMRAMEAEITRLHKSIGEAIELVINLPCGGIGPGGMAQEELDAEAEAGRHAGNDAMFDIGQRVYLVLARTKEVKP